MQSNICLQVEVSRLCASGGTQVFGTLVFGTKGISTQVIGTQVIGAVNIILGKLLSGLLVQSVQTWYNTLNSFYCPVIVEDNLIIS